jgi:hypothetical protein
VIDIADYLAERVDRSGGLNACWPWLLSTGGHGYGQGFDGTTVRLAHRLAWLAWVGPIYDGMTIDHLCRNRVCCNPAHLRLLSNEENGRLNGNAVKTHCKRGHPFDAENTRINRRGHRICRACHRLRWQRSEAA